MPSTEQTATKTVKRIDLAPGQFYEFTVALPTGAPGPLSIHAFDADIVINPGDTLDMIITAVKPPLAKSQVMPLPQSTVNGVPGSEPERKAS